VFISLGWVITYAPDALGHIDNYTEANPLVTPSHIQPEWYFLPYYVVLRAVPNKLLGVIAIAGSIGILALMPWITTSIVRGSSSNMVSQLSAWVFFANFALLTWLGAQSPEYPYDALAQLSTLLYFSWFVMITPLIGVFESLAIKIKNTR
jgi:quinol-cytochrome oxidoreductase complex cytochrome b subunit